MSPTSSVFIIRMPRRVAVLIVVGIPVVCPSHSPFILFPGCLEPVEWNLAVVFNSAVPRRGT